MNGRHLLAGLAGTLLLLAGCGSAGPPAATTTGSPTGPPSVAATPSPSPSGGTLLTFSGAVSGTVTSASPAGTCGRSANGGGADLRFQLSGQAYALSIELLSYHGPGTYPLPPDRVSLHTLTIGPASQFFGSQSGTVSVAPGDRSGSVDAALSGNQGSVHVSGAWACSA